MGAFVTFATGTRWHGCWKRCPLRTTPRPGAERGQKAVSDADLIRYLDAANRLDYVQAYKRHSLDMLNARPGDRILEVGCGPGMDTLALAGRMSGTGHVIGLDTGPIMIAEARRRAQGCEDSPDYLVGRALQLSFGAGVFDG